MPTPILATKLYIPPPRPKIVLRPRLIERLNEVLHRKLTLISAPAGFGKTTLVSEWVASCERPVAWLSLDEGDNDPTRFLTYLIAALQTIAANIGGGALGMLQSPQPPSAESILTVLAYRSRRRRPMGIGKLLAIDLAWSAAGAAVLTVPLAAYALSQGASAGDLPEVALVSGALAGISFLVQAPFLALVPAAAVPSPAAAGPPAMEPAAAAPGGAAP